MVVVMKIVEMMRGTWLRRVAASEFAFQLDKAVLFGTPGMPEGVVGASGTVSVSKDIGQVAATVTGGWAADRLTKV